MPPSTTARRTRRTRQRVSRVDVAIFVSGLVFAVAAGVIAYRIVGPYGDGPLNVGLYRMKDPETGRQLLYREVRAADGKVARFIWDEGRRTLREVRMNFDIGGRRESLGMHYQDGKLAGIDRDNDQDGKPDVRDYYNDPSGLSKMGFSLAGNGVIDAWQYRDKKGALQKIEVSRRQNGVVDRWEYYENRQLSKVEEDGNYDGRADRWLTYEAGILMEEQEDRNGDGKPDARR